MKKIILTAVVSSITTIGAFMIYLAIHLKNDCFIISGKTKNDTVMMCRKDWKKIGDIKLKRNELGDVDVEIVDK